MVLIIKEIRRFSHNKRRYIGAR